MSVNDDEFGPSDMNDRPWKYGLRAVILTELKLLSDGVPVDPAWATNICRQCTSFGLKSLTKLVTVYKSGISNCRYADNVGANPQEL